MSELLRALGVLAEPPSPTMSRPAAALGLPPPPSAAEHADVFLFQFYPYASVYLGPEGKLGGEARDRVAGFWRALGFLPPAEADHLTRLLGLYAALAEDASDKARHAAKALLWEHLLSWLPFYLDAVERCGSPFYRAWAALLGEALVAEAERFGPAVSMPLALRAQEPLPDPTAAGSRDFLGALLAPARTGMVVVRSDLARAAEELGLGLRIAERKFVLEGLMGQDPERTLGWLSAEAATRSVRYRSWPRALGAIAAVWAGRAQGSADLLANLAVAARELSGSGLVLEARS